MVVFLPSLQAEAARQMDQAIGCQIGCQNPEETTAQAGESQITSEKVVSRIFASWKQLDGLVRQVECLRLVA